MADGVELMMTMISMISTMWPPQATVYDGCAFDFIVVGSGAGSVVANRLSERSDFNVLLIEAGDIPDDDTRIPAKFGSVINTPWDWNFTAEADATSVSQEKGRFSVPHGKLLGGTSSINHLFYLRGDPADFNEWADLLNDPSWRYDNIVPYFNKIENKKYEPVMNSPRESIRSNGMMSITSQPTDVSKRYIEAFDEVGYPANPDMNGGNIMGYGDTQYHSDVVRQDTAMNYILPARNRPNFHLLKNAFVTKVIIENKVAIGVEVVLFNNEKIIIKANNEVIVSAGVVNSPKLLSLSGVGPKEVLEKYGIPVVVDLPVGENLQEHVVVPVVHKMEYSTAKKTVVSSDKLPFPFLLGSCSLNGQAPPEYQTTVALLEHDTDFLMALCSGVFGIKTETCTMLVDECAGRDVMYSFVTIYKPASRGSVTIQSADPYVYPKIKFNFYENKTDLTNMVLYIKDFLSIGNSTYFKNAKAELIMPELDDCSGDYWECYTMQNTVHMFHPTSTCPMGTVLDSKANVKGLKRLRVVDSSALPSITRANNLAAVIMLAEKISDDIKNSYPRC
ncbi:glucose dehydrogenase [FAD, quinone] [Manduca sexta]|uniref:Glucose-methanol-choline oxidoreductase N-terminal domain-containing protein n=1 Tax=Manduca sexta TaxID=7130 RepID=A0A921YTL2_MANSE|nr:glucose dehydrogenase [FAD, quinone] [Manduca sexta]KAG6445695.1 hypothetical protein O3G_MSEX004033 [Manduca sexta]KAG6445696.1 hypothetical protein O3G_MSEX004033 [Manduca sexta]